MTQHELAQKSGVGRATIASLEVGHRRAQPKTARKLAEALGVAPAELYGRARPAEIPGVGPLTTVYEHTDDGWWVVSVPEIPGAVSQGRTREEAREMIQDAVRMPFEAPPASKAPPLPRLRLEARGRQSQYLPEPPNRRHRTGPPPHRDRRRPGEEDLQRARDPATVSGQALDVDPAELVRGE